MITIQITEGELNSIIKALQTRKTKKISHSNCWERRIQTGIKVPLEVAEAFITIERNSAAVITPLLERLEQLKND